MPEPIDDLAAAAQRVLVQRRQSPRPVTSVPVGMPRGRSFSFGFYAMLGAIVAINVVAFGIAFLVSFAHSFEEARNARVQQNSSPVILAAPVPAESLLTVGGTMEDGVIRYTIANNSPAKIGSIVLAITPPGAGAKPVTLRIDSVDGHARKTGTAGYWLHSPYGSPTIRVQSAEYVD